VLRAPLVRCRLVSHREHVSACSIVRWPSHRVGNQLSAGLLPSCMSNCKLVIFCAVAFCVMAPRFTRTDKTALATMDCADAPVLQTRDMPDTSGPHLPPAPRPPSCGQSPFTRTDDAALSGLNDGPGSGPAACVPVVANSWRAVLPSTVGNGRIPMVDGRGSHDHSRATRGGTHANIAWTHYDILERHMLGRTCCNSSCPYSQKCGDNMTPALLKRAHQHSFG